MSGLKWNTGVMRLGLQGVTQGYKKLLPLRSAMLAGFFWGRVSNDFGGRTAFPASVLLSELSPALPRHTE